MNFPFFVARKVAFSGQKSFSSTIIRIAIAAIALSISVMIITTALVSGFKTGISEKVFGFWGHIHISHFQSNQSFEVVPISTNQPFYGTIDTIRKITFIEETQFGEKERETFAGIRHIQSYANKAGVIKTKDQLEGIILKGIGRDYDWEFLQKYIVEGKPLQLPDTTMSREVIISHRTAKRLKLGVGDKFTVHFVEGEVQLIRQFNVSGIYKTGLDEYDRKFALVDIRQIQKLNQWEEDMVSGFEVFVEDIRDMEILSDYLYEELDYELVAKDIKSVYPNLFAWLDLQDTNENVILLLMIFVSIINMTTALLILILERTNMIGILKALGSSNWQIRKVFIYHVAYIVVLGLIWGNIFGIGLSLIQQHFGIITLPEKDYYVSVAPIQLNALTVIFINIGTLLITVLTMIIPSYLVTRITPVKAIRFK